MSDALVILFAVIIITFIIASFAKPAYAVGLLVCSFTFEKWLQANSGFFLEHDQIVNYASGIVMMIAVYVAYMRGRSALTNYPAVGKVILLLYGMAILSILWSIDSGTTSRFIKSALPYIAVNIVATPLVVSDADDLRDALKSTLVFGSLVVLMIIFSGTWDVRGLQLASEEIVLGRLNEEEGGALSLATTGGYVAIIAMLMNFDRQAMFWRIARWGLLVAGMFLVVRSQSRGQLVGVILSILVFLPISRRVGNARNNTGLIAAMGGMILVTYKLYDAYFLKWRFEAEHVTRAYEEGRLEPVKILLSHMWEEGPVYWLLGLGNSVCFSSKVPTQGYPHFVLFEVLGEEGFIGFVLFLLIPILMLVSAKRIWPIIRHNNELRGLFAVTGSLFFFELLLSCKQGSLLRAHNLMAFAVMGGIFALSLRRQYQAYVAQYTGSYSSDALPAAPPAQA